MADFQPITYARHGLKRRQGYSNYAFAAGDAICALVAQELPRAALSMPIGFIAEGEGFTPVALMGLVPGQNLYVAADGRWLNAYIPAPYRGYPFRLGLTEQGDQLLCVDEASGLISDTLGTPFFNEDQSPEKGVLEMLDFFVAVESNRALTRQACAVLHTHQLIQPWIIKVQDQENEQQVEGLFRIDEAALNALPAEALAEVRDANALALAYCQLLSMQHLQALGKLAHERNEAEKALGFGQDNGTFSFGA